MLENLSVAYIHSTNATALVEWYKEKLELDIVLDVPGWTQFGVNGPTRFAIDHVEDNPSQVEAQKIMLSFEVKDLEACVETLRGRGVEFFEGDAGAIFDVGPSRVASFEDPDGNWIQLNEFKK